jgi:maltose-binding protein MalE
LKSDDETDRFHPIEQQDKLSNVITLFLQKSIMAKKPKGFSDLLKQQQQSNQFQQQALEKLQQQVQQAGWGDRFSNLVVNPQGEVKMSEVLEEFVEPYVGSAPTYSQRQTLFGLAIIAWNLALMSESERQIKVDEFLQQVIKDDRFIQQDTRAIIEGMITRKQAFFADCQRRIIDYKLQDLGDQFHLSVASTLE